MPKPTLDDIRDAGRQLQRGGLLGRGSSKKAADGTSYLDIFNATRNDP